MKVNTESGGHCDFCGFYDAKFSINGGLWWLCKPCMEGAYGPCPCTPDLIVEHLGVCKMAGEEE